MYRKESMRLRSRRAASSKQHTMADCRRCINDVLDPDLLNLRHEAISTFVCTLTT